jgi:tRNA A-37 threonylcarbamoyl transferase component Bud32
MAPRDDRRSERFGRYEILGELGRGAMGVVYKARDPKINRVVAVKTVSLAGQSPEEEREYRERFFREAEAAGRLSHPGIVTIFDVGEEPETHDPYIVMEFVGGQSLDKRLERDDHKLPLETALQLTFELAEALDCAHGQGVVHRDLKPANILLTEDGHAKIADFGVAKLNLASHTLAGRALGTPAYMSPEQLNGEAVDGRSDLFSLGVVLYTMVTGYRPFQGNSAVTVSFKVVNRDPIPATLLNTELPQGLEYIIGRAMAKDPTERYQRGMEMALDIREMREKREPWSKAKLQVSPASSEKVRASLGQPWIATDLLLSARSFGWGNGGREKLPEGVRRMSLAGAVVLLGLLVFGLWVISFGARGVLPRDAGPLPRAADLAATKTAVTPTASSTAASVDTEPTLVVKELPKAAPRNRTYARAAKVAPAKSSTVSPAKLDASPAVPDVAAVTTGVPPATLDIEVEHHFTAAQLSVWVDDHSIYTHPLEGTDKKRLVVFHGVQGHESHALQLAPGKHRVRVEVESGVDSYDQSRTVTGEFASGNDKVLRVRFSKSGEMSLSLQ